MGIGPNKLIAKIASDFRKPDGLTVITPDQVQAFLDPLSIRVIPGIGPKTGAFLRARGIATVAELRLVEATQLVEWFGKWGHDLHARARGISESPVSNEWERKSVGEQETFERDTLDPAFVLERARVMAGSVFQRMRADGFQGFRTVTITVRFENFVTLSRSLTAGSVVLTPDALVGSVEHLFAPFFDERENPRSRRIRLIGLGQKLPALRRRRPRPRGGPPIRAHLLRWRPRLGRSTYGEYASRPAFGRRLAALDPSRRPGHPPRPPRGHRMRLREPRASPASDGTGRGVARQGPEGAGGCWDDAATRRLSRLTSFRWLRRRRSCRRRC